MKPGVIVLGGCGFIGRNLVDFLITNDLVECVRVVDKVPPQIAWLNHKHETIFNDVKVSFRSANLINPESCKSALAPDENGRKFDFVVNCAGETKSGQTDAVYKEGIFKLSTLCASEAAQNRVKHYVEISSGNMGSNEKVPLREDCKKEPWTNMAKWKSQVEDHLSTIPDLNYTILRPAIVYGIGDKTGLSKKIDSIVAQKSDTITTNGVKQKYHWAIIYIICFSANLYVSSVTKVWLLDVIYDDHFTQNQSNESLPRVPQAPRLVVGSIYKHLGECMKLLWTRDLKMNTVHVEDLCRAIWHVLLRDDTNGEIYNVVDDSDTTQGIISSFVSEIFNINHDYWGSAISTIAKADLACVVEEVNDKHMGPWAEVCSRDEIFNTPLSPYIDKELLSNKHLYLDGTKLIKTGFTYSVPHLSAERLEEILLDYVLMNLFPKSLIV